jgi:hypothetical protein
MDEGFHPVIRFLLIRPEQGVIWCSPYIFILLYIQITHNLHYIYNYTKKIKNYSLWINQYLAVYKSM